MSAIDESMEQYVGKRIDGGCDTCNAYQTIEKIDDDVWMCHIHHDSWCPTHGNAPKAPR